jgi:hypothetical protein
LLQLAFVTSLTAPLSATAQEQPPAAPTPEPAPEAPPAATSEAEAEPAPADAAPTIEDRVSTLEGQVEGITEPLAAAQSQLSTLSKLKFSGYIQSRYEWHDDADFGLDASNRPRGTNRFYVRRARLKSTYRSEITEVVLQLDAVTQAELRDAEVSLVLDNTTPWLSPSDTLWELKLTMGQFKIPFGFEVLQSSSTRELTERARAPRTLFPGERDRGLRLTFNYEWLRFMGAVINGHGISDSIYGVFDQTSWKDVVGRLGVDFDWIVGGVSGYYGRSLRTTLGTTGPTGMPASYLRFGKQRFGADVQTYFDVPSVGGLSVRGEAIWAMDENLKFSGAAPNECRDATGFGWYATVVQNFGDFVGAAARFDQFEPDNSVGSACTMAQKTAEANDRLSNLSLAVIGYLSGNLKLTVQYDHQIESGPDKDNDFVTTQLQGSF